VARLQPADGGFCSTPERRSTAPPKRSRFQVGRAGQGLRDVVLGTAWIERSTRWLLHGVKFSQVDRLRYPSSKLFSCRQYPRSRSKGNTPFGRNETLMVSADNEFQRLLGQDPNLIAAMLHGEPLWWGSWFSVLLVKYFVRCAAAAWTDTNCSRDKGPDRR
jgi:hypothetical protein